MTLTNAQFQELIDSAAKASFSDNRDRAEQLEARALSQLNNKENAVAAARLIIAAKALIDA